MRGSSIALMSGHFELGMRFLLIIEAVVGIRTSASWTGTDHDGRDKGPFR